MRRIVAFTAAAMAAVVVPTAFAVDRSKFRTCAKTGFCRRHRSLQAEPAFQVTSAQLELQGDTLTGSLGSSTGNLDLSIQCLVTGAARVRLTEQNMPARWESPDILVGPIEGATGVQLVGASDTKVAAAVAAGAVSGSAQSYATYATAEGAPVVLAVTFSPFRIEMAVDNKAAVTVNGDSLLHFEQRRTPHKRLLAEAGAGDAGADNPCGAGGKLLDWGEDGKPICEGGEAGAGADTAAEEAAAASARQLAVNDADCDACWEESFGSHADSKPHGPTSVGVDTQFPGRSHIFGIPEHADSFALKATDGSNGGHTEPYRLYNLDVFEYELNEPMALYGHIPFMVAHSPAVTSAVYWHNPSETFVDTLPQHAGGARARWISESGNFDLWLLPGPTPAAVYQQWAKVVGTTLLPPKFALGYHQCRWNYKDEQDVAGVDSKFEEHDFPYDVLWLDIEYTDGKRYFTWDKAMFPTPKRMQESLWSRGRRMVTIIDPHIKRDDNYHIHKEATEKGLYVKNKSGGDFDGWCWPGSSSYLDFTSKDVRAWWADQFRYDKFQGSTPSLYTWNDMNEPSVFNGPEVSMSKDALSLAGVEHREWHNLYGFYQQQATAEGQIHRNEDQNTRSFVLSRAFFAGSQRHGAIWTGDNFARWDHLKIASPMLLSINVGGLPFAGADVGGFFKNPDTELLTRWYGAGAYQPFFRAHAHIETKRREPWLFGEEVMLRLRKLVRERYALLPLWYTVFEESHRTGKPVMRAMWFEFPEEEALAAVEDQWMVGDALLVHPITDAGATQADVALPSHAGKWWYNVRTRQQLAGAQVVTVQAALDEVPVLQRGGSIVPRQERPRRCADLMRRDPFTLTVALSEQGAATGQLYLDDGISFDYQRKAAFQRRALAAARRAQGGFSLASTLVGGSDAGFPVANVVERVVVLGVRPADVPTRVVASEAGHQWDVEFSYDAETASLQLRKPSVTVGRDWTIVME